MPLRPSLRRAVATGTGGLLVAVSLAAAPSATATTPAAPAPAPAPSPAPPDAPPAAYPRQAPLPEPVADPTDASIARGALPYDRVAPLLNDLMAASDRVSAEVVGTSTQGRDLYLVTVTAPESAQEAAQQQEWRDRIKDDAAAAADDEALQEGYKAPIWFNANIHGNEWEGTDASLRYIEDVATSTDPATQALLAEHRLHFTVVNNPDGRVLGQRRTALDLDPNRDFVTSTTPETRAVRDLAEQLQPVFFSDLHGYTDVLQVEPCGPPHGESYDYDLFIPHAYASALRIERDVVAAGIEGGTYRAEDGSVTTEDTGRIQIPYRDVPSGWDDWPPVFTAQYLAFHGAISSTVELPLGRVELDAEDPALDTPEEVAAASAAASAVDTATGVQVIDSTVDYVAENAAALVENQIEIFRRGDAGEPLRDIPVGGGDAGAPESPQEWKPLWGEEDRYRDELPRAYVIPVGEGQRSATDAAALVDHLLAHEIEVGVATEAFTAGDTTHPEGSYVVDMHQPLRGLANAMLAEGSDISDRVPTMYDVSAWSLSLLWGASVAPVGATGDELDAPVEPVVVAAPTGGVAGGAAEGLRLEVRGVDEWRAVNALLAAGVRVTALDDGSVALGPYARRAAVEVAERYGVSFTAAERGAAERGTVLEPLRVGWTGESDDLLSLQELGFADLVEVTPAAVADGAVDLASLDVLWLGGGFDLAVAEDAAEDEGALSAEQAEAARAALQAYVDAGGGLAGTGPGADAAANAVGLWTSTAVTAREDANGVLEVDSADQGPVAAYPQTHAFAYPPTWFTDLGEGVSVEQTYQGFTAGHWLSSEPSEEEPAPAPDGRESAQGQAAVISGTAPSGARALVFGTDPVFRTHPKGALSTVARALFWAAGEGPETTAG